MDKPLTIKMYRVCWTFCMIVFGAFLANQAVAATPVRTDPGQDPIADSRLIREVPFTYPGENSVSPNHPESLAEYALEYESRARYEPRIPFLAADANTAIHLESEWGLQDFLIMASAHPEPSKDGTEVIAEVPLPAAIWLFASALIGFVSFSARRSI